MGKLYNDKMGRLQVCPDWRLLEWGGCRCTNVKQGIPHDWLGCIIWLSLVGPKSKVGTNVWEVVKSQPLGADCYRGYSLASWIAARDSNLTSYQCDLQQAVLLDWLLQIIGWFTVQVAASYGPEFCFYIQSGLCPFAYSVFQLEAQGLEPEYTPY